VDHVLIQALRWPARNSRGRKTDTTAYLQQFMTFLLLEQQPSRPQPPQQQLYIPGPAVWEQCIVSSAKGAPHDPARWHLVRNGFDQWSRVADPAYRPNHRLLRHGLDVSEALHDASLAADLLFRLLGDDDSLEGASSSNSGHVTRHRRGRTLSSSTPSPPPLPAQDLVRGMEICIRHGYVEHARIVLDHCRQPQQQQPQPNDQSQQRRRLLPPPMLHQMYHACLRGYATQGDSASTIALLQQMKDDLPLEMIRYVFLQGEHVIDGTPF